MIDHYRETAFLTASSSDMAFYESLLPEKHKLCGLVDVIDFEGFRPIVESAYHLKGQPTGYAMVTFKMEVLKYFYNLSDREVIDRVATDIAFRWFLKLPITKTMSDHTILTRFRDRLGKEKYELIFQQLIAQARKVGLVKDQLRLKDATHVIANISIPSTIALISQTREKLLKIIEKFDPEASGGYQLAVEAMREKTKDANDAVRLNERIELLSDVVSYSRKQLESEINLPTNMRIAFEETVALAEKILDQKKATKVTREIRSLVDPDAMRGKHGEYYDGYVLDVCMDADSELITALDVMVAGASEAKGAIALIEQERSKHGNSPKELSIDGAGYDGEMIRQLESPEGPAMTVYTPPKSPRYDVEIRAEQFELVTNPDGDPCVRCPEGKLSKYREKEGGGMTYRFTIETCKECPLASRCFKTNKKSPFGRSVRKSQYEAEYAQVRSRSKSERFAEVRRRHPAIERKLNECVNHHGGRRSRYRGIKKVPIQMFGIGLAINMKRMVKLLSSGLRECMSNALAIG